MAEPELPMGEGGRRLYLFIAVGVAISFVMLFLFFRSCGGGGGKYAVLYSNLELKDAGEIAKNLEDEKIPYRLEEEGRTITVPREMTARARMLLATEGLPNGGLVGFEIFDETQMGASSFDRKVKFIRAVSGELSRAIASLDPVERAKVQIVIPEEKLFSLEKNPVTASVLVRLKLGKNLGPEQVNGIIYLVSTSVEGLKPEHVAVIDESGRMLNTAFASLTPPLPGLAIQPGLVGKGLEEKIVVEGVSTEESAGKPGPEAQQEKPKADLSAQLAARGALEEKLQQSAQSVLSNFYPEHAVQARVNVELKEGEAGQSVGTISSAIRRLTTLILIDEKFPLTPQLKKDTYAAVAAAIGYDPDRDDQIELRTVPLMKEKGLMGQPPSTGIEKNRFSLFSFLSHLLARVPRPSLRTLGIISLVGVVVLLVRRRLNRRAERPFASRGGEGTTILSPRTPGREGASPFPPPIRSEKGTVEELRTLAETDPEKIASALKHWLSEENG